MINSCPFCSHQDAVLYRADQQTRRGGQRSIYRCKDCMILYPGSRMDIEESEKYLAGIHTNQTGFEFRLPGTDEINSNVRFWSFLGKYIRKDADVLDVGAFDGTFCQVLKNLGYDAWGVEPQDRAVAAAKDRGINVSKGSFPDKLPADISGRRYSLVTIMEAIYYFKDLKKSLKRVEELLENDGYILIKCHQGFSRYYDKKEHSYFSRYGDNVQSMPTLPSLREILNRSGFRLVKVFGIDSEDTLPIHVGRVWPRTAISLALSIYNRFFLKYLSIGISRSDRLVILAQRRGG